MSLHPPPTSTTVDPPKPGAASRLPALVLTLLLLWQFTGVAGECGFSRAILRSAWTPGAGARQSLPPEVLEGAALLARHDVRVFRLEASLEADPLLRQRLGEFTYPRRVEKGATIPTLSRAGVTPAGCKLLEAGELVALHACD